MSNHRPVNDPGPSLVSIATGTGLTLAAVTVALYILWGPLDSRGVLGAGAAFLLAVLLMTQTMFRFSERLSARDRIKRWEVRQSAEAERAARMARPSERLLIQASNPGDGPVYREADHGPVLEPPVAAHARYGGPGHTSWPEPIAQRNPEPEYPVTESDDYLVRAAEATLADRGDEKVWPVFERHAGESGSLRSPTEVREVGEETRRIEYPGQQVHGPSAAALRPIEVPVFRSERDRSEWADRHALPTEVLPLPEGHRVPCDVDTDTGWCATHDQFEG
jgi:hypothetical protein